MKEAHVRTTRLLVLVLGIVVCGAGSSAAADAAAHHGKVNCHGGTIAAGTYRSLRISGACTLVQSGNVTVRGNVVVTPTGLFNAGTPAKLVVGGDVIVRHHGATAIGCSPDIGCATLGADVVRGSIHAQGAAAVIVHGTTIGGDATIRGGGQTMDCTVVAPFGAPYYSVMEDSAIGGNLVIRGLHTCWLGVIRNHVGGTVRLIGNRFGDPDADEVVTNVIGGNLACFDNIAPPQVGDSTGATNVVAGQKRGECKGL
jgi:hypothetical protein